MSSFKDFINEAQMYKGVDKDKIDTAGRQKIVKAAQALDKKLNAGDVMDLYGSIKKVKDPIKDELMESFKELDDGYSLYKRRLGQIIDRMKFNH